MLYKFLQLFKSFSKKERLIFSAALLIFLISGITAVINNFYQSTEARPIEGGVYNEGIVGQPIAVNPLIVSDNDADRDLTALLFASLYDLAESIKPDDTQKVWTVKLRPELRWSDGQPLTSDDVIFTIETIQNPDTRSSLFTTWQGVSAERLSEREFRLSLKTPYAFFLDNLKDLRPAPQHIFDNIPPQNFRLSDYNLKPVGSGPYKFAGFTKQESGFIEKYMLVANDQYLDRPFIRNFNVFFFVSKADALNAFNIREIDGIGGLEQSDLASARINNHVISVPRPRYYAIFLNQGTNLPLKEKEVRLALNYATDKAKLVDQALGGNGSVVNGPIPPSVAGYDEMVLAGNTFSLDLASTTLDKAGWKTGEDGIRVKTIQKNKIKLQFDIIVPEVKFLMDTVKLIQQDWQKIGVGLNPVILKPLDALTAAIKPRNYQMIIFGNTLNGNPDVFSFWHSSQRFDPGLNLSLFSDKTTDGLLESIRQDVNDSTRGQSLSKLQKLINDQKPAIFLYSPDYLYLTSRNLGGFTAKSIAVPSDRFEKVNGWYLKTARVFK